MQVAGTQALPKPAKGFQVRSVDRGAAMRILPPHSRLKESWAVNHCHHHHPTPYFLLHLRVRLDQGPDTSIINNSSTCELWAHCVPGPVDTELGKSLAPVAHSLTAFWAPRWLLVWPCGSIPDSCRGWIFPSLLSLACSPKI